MRTSGVDPVLLGRHRRLLALSPADQGEATVQGEAIEDRQSAQFG
ncbi:hypothetical protein [Micropruina sp.]